MSQTEGQGSDEEPLLIQKEISLDPRIIREIGDNEVVTPINRAAAMVTNAEGQRRLVCTSLGRVHNINSLNEDELKEAAKNAALVADFRDLMSGKAN